LLAVMCVLVTESIVIADLRCGEATTYWIMNIVTGGPLNGDLRLYGLNKQTTIAYEY